MNSAALARLGQNAAAFAKVYVDITEELIREGVPERIARTEARAAAVMAICWGDSTDYDDDYSVCPECGEDGADLTSQEDNVRLFTCKNGHCWNEPFTIPEDL